MNVLGIDIGGSGIKGAIVNTETGELLSERHRFPTPKPSTPRAIAETISMLSSHFSYTGIIGCGFPALIKNGFIKTAANIHQSWIEVDAARLFKEATSQNVFILNDADAAGLAEVQFGAGKGKMGTIILITVGTGIGTALFTQGKLLPNTELGHIKMYGKSAEKYCSDLVREKKDLSWMDWGKRFNEYLNYIEFLFSPELFIIGGGVSKKFDLYSQFLHCEAEIVPASLRNQAGIIGAARFAAISQD
ncbi:MAG: ROK family protein [Bacteroidales bacterium]|jgi:polyphosphate glucokinase|nr:ROK family protein [Bacteroidales bacterium]